MPTKLETIPTIVPLLTSPKKPKKKAVIEIIVIISIFIIVTIIFYVIFLYYMLEIEVFMNYLTSAFTATDTLTNYKIMIIVLF